jgi:nucleotide-binding universal stress UspA family protein
MTTINPPIIVGVDGSVSARQAVLWAAREAAHRKAPLRLVHATVAIGGYTPVALPQEVYDALAGEGRESLRQATELVRDLTPGVDVSTDLRTGSPAQILVAESRAARMLVLGSRGLGGFTGMLVGSVAVALAAHGHCPIVVVRGEHTTDTGSRPVVVGIDGSPASEAAIGFAFEQASWLGVLLVALHTWSDTIPASTLPNVMVDWKSVEEEEQRVLAERLAGWQEKYPDVSVQRVFTPGRPAHSLLVQTREAQLVVVGSRGRGGVKGMLLGSTSQALLHHSACPVAVVRPESAH